VLRNARVLAALFAQLMDQEGFHDCGHLTAEEAAEEVFVAVLPFLQRHAVWWRATKAPTFFCLY